MNDNLSDNIYNLSDDIRQMLQAQLMAAEIAVLAKALFGPRDDDDA